MEALLIIDMIMDFVTGKFGFEEAKKIVPKLQLVLSKAREKRVPVFYVCDSHKSGDPELSIWGEHAMDGTPGSEVIPELAPASGEHIIKKRTYSAFYETELEKLLRKGGINHLILTGVVTDICVKHTAADAFFRGFRISVLSDCTASPQQHSHAGSLEYMKRIYGARILSSTELLREWE
jgi:nicotinamidase-related amidase